MSSQRVMWVAGYGWKFFWTLVLACCTSGFPIAKNSVGFVASSVFWGNSASGMAQAIDFESWGVTDDYMRVLSRDFNLADIRCCAARSSSKTWP
eukprot:6473211-Amphidinium_carterae.2